MEYLLVLLIIQPGKHTFDTHIIPIMACGNYIFIIGRTTFAQVLFEEREVSQK